MQAILAPQAISVTDLKRNPAAVIAGAGDDAVAILSHNKPQAYLLSAVAYQRLLERLDDAALIATVRQRSKERRVKVRLDEL